MKEICAEMKPMVHNCLFTVWLTIMARDSRDRKADLPECIYFTFTISSFKFQRLECNIL